MKKNVLKKFAAAALAAATVMSSMSVMAFAAEPETGSVTITKYMSNTGAGKTLSPEEYTGEAPNGKEEDLLQNVEFAYVKVGDRVQVDTAEGKSSKTEIQYKVTDGKFLEAIGIDKTKASANFTQTELNNAIKTHKNDTIKFVKENADNANKKSTVKTTGEAKFEGLSLHKLYVFAETDATNAVLASDGKTKVNVTKVSVPFLVSLPFTGNDGKPVTALKVYPKNSTGEDTIDKKIVEDDGEKASTTANIGDTINYKVTYSIPVGENGLESLVVTDTMSKGLTFVNNADNIKVLNGDVVVDKTMYTVNANKDNFTNVTTITITFDSDNYCKKLAPNTTPNFTITYKATLNENAVLGQSGNTNDVFVTYTGDVKRETEHKDTKVFTYGIDLLKKGEGTTAGLKDVKFELTDGANEIKVLKSGDAYYPSNGTGASSTVTTDEQGKIYIRGLKPGTYQLKETKTNAGYVLLKEPVKIVITEGSTTPSKATASVGNKEVTMNADNGSATAIVPLTVVNSKGFDLPATGGRGIALFTIAGIAIVAAAGSLLFMRKRSK